MEMEVFKNIMVKDQYYSNLKKEYKEKKAWGLLSSINLYDCNPLKIRNKEIIKEFAVKLCEKIKMKRFGDPTIVYFGKDERVAGYSLVQLIETSLISGHFANQSNAIYLDIFSCKFYNPKLVADFSKKFFNSRNYTLNVLIRK